MTDRQNFIGDIDRPYYWASEVPKLVGPGTPSLSTFYRYAREGKVNKIDIQGPEDAYNGEDVKKFLRGELSGRRKSTQQKQRGEKPSPATRKQELVVDVAKQSDLLPLYTLESDQLDLLRAIVPPVLHGWLHVNDHAYWVLSSAINRQEILAMLGVLPLREETIQKLLRKEILPSQILPSDVLSYTPGGSYSCYITSAAARSEHRHTVLLLVERLFAYWCEQSIEIKAIFASVDESTDDNIPLLHIVTQCFFILLDEEGQWLLRPLHRKNHPVSFIRNYRECIEQRKREQKKEGNSMLAIDSPMNSLDTLRRLFERKLAAKGNKDFSEVVHAYIKMDADGNITRKDGSSQHKVWIGSIRNDDDIRATLRINASLFGASQKFTEDQLVSSRREWLKKNHDIYRILEVDGEVVGFILAMPLPMPVIDRLLTGKIKVGDIPIEDLLEYKPGEQVDIYLQTLGLHKKIQDGEKFIHGFYLVAGTERLISDVGSRGIEIRAIYTRSDEKDGVKLAAALGFEEIPAPLGVEKIVLKLDFSKEKPSLRAYKQTLEKYKREHLVEDNA